MSALHELEVRIEDVGREGDGIARVGAETLFVPFTVTGDVVRVTREGNRATLSEVLEPGPGRAEPVSPYFGQCGGCALQHMSRDTYRTFKRELVVTALQQASVVAEVAPLVEAWGQGRRRASLHVEKGAAGYMKARSHDVLDITSCAILAPALRTAAPAIARALYSVAGDCTASFTATETGLDLSVKSARKLKPAALAAFAQTHRLARLTFNGEPVYMAHMPVVKMGKALVEVPPASFLQATALAEETLAGLVAEAVETAKSVADLFCGIGPFALRLAATSRVLAMDSDAPAIAALEKAVRHVQGLKPMTVKRRDLFRDPLAPVELEGMDAVVFDPPRAGAEAQVKELARSKVKTVVGVSCDPKTFARDAAILIAGGYRLTGVTPVDQFAYSTHVELVGVFRR